MMPKKSYYSIFLWPFLAVVLALVSWPIGQLSSIVQAEAANFTPLQNITQIAAGGSHACALTTDGGVKCWGDNEYGQLGDGTTATKNTAVVVNDLSRDVIAIASGDAHTCALLIGGGIKCWGQNYYGQLGDGTTSQKSTPIDVSGLSNGVIAIAAGGGDGGGYTCALTTGGGVKCWGNNAAGQLGDGTTVNKSTPVNVSGLSNGVIAIAIGHDDESGHTCALTTGGGVKCWGNNAAGQLGDGTTVNKSTPVDVSGLNSGVTKLVAGGGHTCALSTGGGVKCWGENDFGQLGDGTTITRTTPVDVSGLSSDVTALSAGYAHTCALSTGGGVKCWGLNYTGQLGDATVVDRSTPVDVSGLGGGVTALAAASVYSCALTTSGGVKCWGWNYFGQLGDGTGQLGDNTPGFGYTPLDVYSLNSGIAKLAAGDGYTCALTTSGGVKCWGDNLYGLGDGKTTFSTKPVEVSNLSNNVTAVAAAAWDDKNTCALIAGGSVKCWGMLPADVAGLPSNVAAIGMGSGDLGEYACILTTSGGVQCWGANDRGQLGDGTTIDKSTPITVSGLSSGVIAITVGNEHACALLAGGSVKCWGNNEAGQLGDGTTVDRSTPVVPSGLGSGVAAITAGGYHTCALMTSGAAKCWGANYAGQVGDGATDNESTPIDVNGLSSGITTIVAGGDHTCVLTTVGGVKCWGNNRNGQLGDGTAIDRSIPVDVSGLLSGIMAVAISWDHTCAVTTVGGVKCWGFNEFNRLGSVTWRTAPVDVVEATTITPTDTPTATPTNTPTNTPTSTASPTMTATNPPTATPPYSTTPTPTATPTNIPTDTASPTNTPTNPPTTTLTLTPTPMATSLSTATPTVTTVRIEGKVVDKETQNGIPGVLMSLTNVSADAVSALMLTANELYTTTTDLNGVYIFPAVKLGAYTLTGVKAGKVIEAPTPLVINAGGTVQVPPLQATQAKPTIYLPLVTK